MNRNLLLAAVVVMVATAPATVHAAEHVVGQKDKTFSTKTLKARVGDKLIFRNDDTYTHNIFSLSDIQSFDLGSFGHGTSRDVVLKKDGKLEIECAIHPMMKLTVDVSK